MRTLLLSSFIIFIVFSEAAFAQKSSYRISGTIDSIHQVRKIYFTQGAFVPGGRPQQKEIPVKDGRFTITGELIEPAPVVISFEKESNPQNSFSFIADEGELSVSLQREIGNSEIRGSIAQAEVQRFIAGQSAVQAKMQALNESIQQQINAGKDQDSVLGLYRQPLKEIELESIAYQRNTLSQYPNSFISLLLIPELAKSTSDYFEADSLFGTLNCKIRESRTGKFLREYLIKEQKTSIRAFAPDFTLADSSGKRVSLSDFKGQYVLLDFWAAWCRPCRQENPNVVLAYQRFQNKGFTVFGVSLDRERKDWLRAIETDKLTWTHVSDLKYWSSAPAIEYGISSIPRNFLLDPDGRIIARDLRGEDLQARLEEIFADK